MADEQLPVLAPLHAVLPLGFPATLTEIAEQLFLQLLDESIALQSAERAQLLATVALRQVDRLSAELGGGNLYVHKGTSYRLTPRNLAMCKEFRGDYKVLARKYKLSEQQVRNVVDAWQREEFARRQADMFASGKTRTPHR